MNELKALLVMFFKEAATSRPSAIIESELVLFSYLERIHVRLMEGHFIIAGSSIWTLGTAASNHRGQIRLRVSSASNQSMMLLLSNDMY